MEVIQIFFYIGKFYYLFYKIIHVFKEKIFKDENIVQI